MPEATARVVWAAILAVECGLWHEGLVVENSKFAELGPVAAQAQDQNLLVNVHWGPNLI
jgi:hypothetical protein